jgi:hypothetical protein
VVDFSTLTHQGFNSGLYQMRGQCAYPQAFREFGSQDGYYDINLMFPDDYDSSIAGSGGHTDLHCAEFMMLSPTQPNVWFDGGTGLVDRFDVTRRGPADVQIKANTYNPAAVGDELWGLDDQGGFAFEILRMGTGDTVSAGYSRIGNWRVRVWFLDTVARPTAGYFNLYLRCDTPGAICIGANACYETLADITRWDGHNSRWFRL